MHKENMILQHYLAQDGEEEHKCIPKEKLEEDWAKYIFPN